MKEITILELFGGIGALTKAFKNCGIPYRVVDYVEIDKYATASYNAMNDTNFEPQDICKWDKDIKVDLIMHGSPCQDFSIGGYQKSGDKNSGTRSSLMWETVRIVEKIKPKCVIWENVKNLLSEKHKHNFQAYLDVMESLGYKNYYKVLNAKDYGLPQNRERVFTISLLDNQTENNDDLSVFVNDFVFPDTKELKLCVKDLLEDNVDDYFYKVCPSMIRALEDKKVKDITNSKYCNTLTTKQARWNNAGMIVDNKGIRYITGKEAFRFMGFDDEDYDKASRCCSLIQIYKQAGNSIAVNVLEAILKNLIRS